MTKLTVQGERHERLPGLYLLWELPEVLQIGVEYRIENGARTEDGADLVAIFRRVGNDDQEITA